MNETEKGNKFISFLEVNDIDCNSTNNCFMEKPVYSVAIHQKLGSIDGKLLSKTESKKLTEVIIKDSLAKSKQDQYIKKTLRQSQYYSSSVRFQKQSPKYLVQFRTLILVPAQI